MIFLLGAILACYVVLISQFFFGFYKVDYFNTSLTSPQTTFSIIIPFRNEAKNLPHILKSIECIEYPISLFEVILIDDHSTDDSADIVKHHMNESDLNISLFENKKNVSSPKKEAITLAVSKAQNSWILTTDADCILPTTWLAIYNTFILEHKPDLVAGPVTYFNFNSLFLRFQQLDFLSLQSVTIGGFGIDKPFMCNGANLAYKKSCFYELNGYEGNTEIVSGDDLFLLEKAVVYKKSVQYLKSDKAIVLTKPQSSLRALIQQRIRWASKASKYKNPFSKYVSLIVFIMNLSLIAGIVLIPTHAISIYEYIAVLTLKLIIDFTCIRNAARFFRQKNFLNYYLISGLLYPFFTIYIAMKALFNTYQWKERSYKS